jgi:UDP-N-acetyl-D-galactosamine dehydrogenase
MIQKEHKIKDSNALILGITFKENCPDIRNTKVIDIYRELCEFGVNVDIFDPWVCPNELKEEYGVDVVKELNPNKKYEAIILTVAHEDFNTFDFEKYYTQGAVIFDVKSMIDRRWVDGRL